MDETLLRLQLLISTQLQDLQEHKESVENSKTYHKAYMEVLKVIRMLRENPNIKLTCYDGKFWTKEELDKKFCRE
jgi:hypothetical protein